MTRTCVVAASMFFMAAWGVGASAATYPQDVMTWVPGNPLVFQETSPDPRLEETRLVNVRTHWQGPFRLYARVVAPVFVNDGFQVSASCNLVNSGGAMGIPVPNDWECLIRVWGSLHTQLKNTNLTIQYYVCQSDAAYETCDAVRTLTQPITVQAKSSAPPPPPAPAEQPVVLPRVAANLLYVEEFGVAAPMEVVLDSKDPYHTATDSRFFKVSAATDGQAKAAADQLRPLGTPFLKNIVLTIADTSGANTFTFDGGSSTTEKIPMFSWESNFWRQLVIRFRPAKEGYFQATLGWSYQVCVNAPTREVCDPVPYVGQRKVNGRTKGATGLQLRPVLVPKEKKG